MKIKTITPRALEIAIDNACAARKPIPVRHNRKRFEAFCSTYLKVLNLFAEECEFAPEDLIGLKAVYFSRCNHGTSKWPYMVYTPNRCTMHEVENLRYVDGLTIHKASEKGLIFVNMIYNVSSNRDIFVIYPSPVSTERR